MPKVSAAWSGSSRVAGRLAHPLAAVEHEAVGEDLLRQRQAGAHQHRRPVEAMEARDVLADDVQVGRPPLLEGGRVIGEPGPGQVVGQRVEPDVDAVLLVAGERDAPGRSRAADAEVAEPLAQPAEHLVAEVLRLAEGRVLGVQPLEPLLVGGEPEEVVVLLQPLRLEGRMVRAAAVDELLIGLELVAAGAVPAGVDALVDVAGRLGAAHHLDRGHRVVRIGGADEPIEADAEALEGRLPGGGPRIDQLVRRRRRARARRAPRWRSARPGRSGSASPGRAAAGSARWRRPRSPRTSSAAPGARSGRRSRWSGRSGRSSWRAQCSRPFGQ